MSKMKDIWANYIDALKSLNKDFPIELKKPASPEKIEDAEHALKFDLPQDLKDLYQINNGQGLTPDLILFDFRLMTIKEIRENTLKAEDDVLAEEPDYYQSFPVGTVKPKRNHHKWIPFAQREAGNHKTTYLALDMDPGPNGKVGQVITAYPSDNHIDFRSNKCFVVAASLGEFLQMLTSKLESGTVHYKQKDWKHKLRLVKKESMVDSLYKELVPEDFRQKQEEIQRAYESSKPKYRNTAFGVEFQLPENFYLNGNVDSTAARVKVGDQFEYLDEKQTAMVSLTKDIGDDEEAMLSISINQSQQSAPPAEQAKGLVALYEQQSAAYANIPGMDFTLDHEVKESHEGFGAYMYLKQGMAGTVTKTLYYIEPSSMLSISADNHVSDEELETIINSVKRLN